jgi:hypothetical protein
MPIETLRGGAISLVILKKFAAESEKRTPDCNGAHDRNCLICNYCHNKPSCEITTRGIEKDPVFKSTVENSTQARIELTKKMEAIPL